jgi:hypothetical protein
MAECGECRPFAHFSESVTRNTRVRLFLQRLRAGRTPPAPPPFRLETCLLITSSRAMGNERPLKKALVQASASRSCASRRARAFSWCSSELMCAPPPHQLGRCCGPPRLSPEPRVIVFVMFNTLIIHHGNLGSDRIFSARRAGLAPCNPFRLCAEEDGAYGGCSRVSSFVKLVWPRMIRPVDDVDI